MDEYMNSLYNKSDMYVIRHVPTNTIVRIRLEKDYHERGDSYSVDAYFVDISGSEVYPIWIHSNKTHAEKIVTGGTSWWVSSYIEPAISKYFEKKEFKIETIQGIRQRNEIYSTKIIGYP